MPETVTLPAETVLNAVLQSVKAIGECDGDFLADLAMEFYPIPDEEGNKLISNATFDSETDQITLTYDDAPPEENWNEIGEDEELDEPKSSY